MKAGARLILLVFLSVIGFGSLVLIPVSAAAVTGGKTLIYDEASLLSSMEREELNELANELGAERQTDIIVYTTLNESNEDVQQITEDFYDEQAPGYDKKHGNAIIMTLDMLNRDIYMAGFYKAETYLDDSTLDRIRDQITPSLSSGDYKTAFETYIRSSYDYLGVAPGTGSGTSGSSGYNGAGSSNNDYSYGGDYGGPSGSSKVDHLLANTWVQLGIAALIGAVSVGVMAYRSGGRVTVNAHTYQDFNSSALLDREDRYIRTSVTKERIPDNNNNNSGGGGGGTTSGGHSHSGSRGSF